MSSVILVIVIAAMVVSLIVAVYAAWEAFFHSRNVTRVLEWKDPIEHQHPFTKWVCDKMTGSTD